ncbi:MAG TPA: HD domain-containing phosphohydrolase, partial [Candidatus Acidoferrales bacterium]|nr:HD domain-containing phosphohydrolase [Candidatus Acidoferrales bacterium]
GPLDSDEWELMKQHVEFGAQILEKCAGLESIRAMVRHHHEFFDGTGYPEGLSGEKIPLGARVIAIADAYDTITSERTYKRPRPAEEALAELERCGGTQFDPELVEIFVSAMRNLPNPIVEIAPASEKAVAEGPRA